MQKHVRAPSHLHRLLHTVAPLLLFFICVLAQGACGGGGPAHGGDPGLQPLGLPSPGPGPVPSPGGQNVTCPGPGDVPSPFPTDPLPSPFQTPSAGTIPGSFSVTSTGEATYAIPLVVPPGRAGMEPKLALVYDSSSGDGFAGMGWSVAGLSAVSRCPNNLALDGLVHAVSYTEKDQLCLDGKRLRLVGAGSTGPHPQAYVKEYRTYPDTFAKVLAYYPSGWNHANGPQHLLAYMKSGAVVEYGTSSTGQVMGLNGVIRSWLATKSRDRRGNTIAYAYKNLPGAGGHTVEHAPDTISYTGYEPPVGGGAPALAPTRQVVFKYDTKEPGDVRTLFTGGMDTQSSLRLRSIEMHADGALVRTYGLAYEQGPVTKRTVLAQVQECGADSACKPPTSFGYSGGTAGFEKVVTSIPKPTSDLASPMFLDMTGDGLDDLVIPDVSMFDGHLAIGDVATVWETAANRGPVSASATYFPTLGNATDPDHSENHASPLPMQWEAVQPELGTAIDYNQDGLMDVLAHDVYGNDNHWWVFLAGHDGQGHVKLKKVDTGIQTPFPLAQNRAAGLQGTRQSVHLADVDGDGVPDLIQCSDHGESPVDDNPGTYTWYLHHWTPARPGWELGGTPIDKLQGYPCNSELYPVDLDADGKVDLVVQGEEVVSGQPVFDLTTYTVLTWSTDGWHFAGTGLPQIEGGGSVLFLDVNGDGLPDAVESGFQDNQLRTYLNTGAGFGPAVSSLAQPVPGADTYAKLARPIDYDGDGRQDLLIPWLANGPDSQPEWRVLRSLGDGSFQVVDPQIPLDADFTTNGYTLHDPRGAITTDVNGDGAEDVVTILNGVFTLFVNQAGDQDLLTAVSDGMNAHDPTDLAWTPTVSIAYEHLIDQALNGGEANGSPAYSDLAYVSHSAAGSDCAYPVRCVVGPRRIVRGYQLDNGGGGQRRFSIAYRDGRFDRLGLGFLGFGERIVHDLDTAAGTAEFFDNATYDGTIPAYPYAGHVVREWRWNPGLPAQPSPNLIELSFTDVTYLTQPTVGGSYFALPYARTVRREQGTYGSGKSKTSPIEQYVAHVAATDDAIMLGQSSTFVSDFDQLGNVRAEHTTTAGVDLATQVKRQFDNDTNDWIIGLLRQEDTCSTAAGETKCRTTRHWYDSFGQVKRTDEGTDGEPETQLEVQIARDAYGNVTNVAAVDGFGTRRTSCTSYDAEGIFPFAMGNAAGHISFTRIDAGFGVPLAVVDPNGLTTQWAYDGFGRTTEVKWPDGTATKHQLTRKSTAGVLSVAHFLELETSTDGGEDTTIDLDTLGRTVRTWRSGVDPGVAMLCGNMPCPASPPPRIYQEIVFDALGEHVARRSVPAAETTPPAKLQYDRFQYDGAGRVVLHTTPWNATTRYDYLGSTLVVTDPLGNPTTAWHDGLGRTTKVTDARAGTTTYGYGPFGFLRVTADPGGAATWTLRDAYGRVTALADPNRGFVASHYDGFGELTSMTDALRTVQLGYDPLGRMAARTDPDGVTTWTWDTAPGKGIGKLDTLTSPKGHTESHTYDAFGRPSTTTVAIDGISLASTISYDPYGRVSTIAYPADPSVGPFQVRRDYDAHGHLIGVHDALSANASAFWRLTSVDGAGRIEGEAFGNGAATTRSWFPERNRVQSIETKSGGQLVQSLAYTYDPKLNLATRSDSFQQQGQTETFSYDELDRLHCVVAGSVLPKGGCKAYQYAANGNLTYKPGFGTLHYDDGAHPHAVTSMDPNAMPAAYSYGYDALGNQTKRPGVDAVDYTAFDMPATFHRSQAEGGDVTFDYDGNQGRIRKTTVAGTTLYFGDLYERVTKVLGGAEEERFYVHSGERAVAVVTRSMGTTSAQYLHADNLGSVNTVTDGAGVVTERRKYDPFGARQDAGSPPDATTRGFTGQEADVELGLVNMKGRIYDPAAGRFLTPDPVVKDPLSGQSWNAYSYVENNPLAYVDPSGFAGEPPLDPAVAAMDPATRQAYADFLARRAAGLPDNPPCKDCGYKGTGSTRKEDQETKQGTRESVIVGAQTKPVDLGTTGSSSGYVPQQPVGLAWQNPQSPDFARQVFLDVAQQTAYNNALWEAQAQIRAQVKAYYDTGLSSVAEDQRWWAMVGGNGPPPIGFGYWGPRSWSGAGEQQVGQATELYLTVTGAASLVKGAAGVVAAMRMGGAGGGGGSRIALSLGEHLERFEAATGAQGWLWWDRAGSFQSAFARAASRAESIHFNLTGLDLERVATSASWSRTSGLVTNAEFRAIITNPELLAKTTFYRSGSIVSTESVVQQFAEIITRP